jgi:hypothetical protein
VIYERKIYSRTYDFVPRNYSGPNAHDHHLHVSVYHDPKRADSKKPWGIEDMALSDADIEKIAKRVRELLLYTDDLPAPAESPTVGVNKTWKGLSFWTETYNAARRVEKKQGA